MAKIFEYEKVVTGAAPNLPKRQRAKARKALIKKKLPDDMVDAFLDAVENNGKLKSVMTDLVMARGDATKKMLGSDALYNARSPIAKKVFAQIVGRQLQLKFNDVFLEIHEKGGNLQVWFHAKGGKTEVVLDHKAKSIF